MKTTTAPYRLITASLRVALVAALLVSGWLIYRTLPLQTPATPPNIKTETSLQIVLRSPDDGATGALNIAVDLYPIDIVAARHEYFTERRPGKRFDDFLSERMKGRTPVSAKLDEHGQALVVVSHGSWWLHAQWLGDENLEWRLPLNVAGRKQTVELTSQNVYTRTKSF